MRLIKLRNINLYAQVDNEDYERCMAYLWYLNLEKGYVQATRNGETILLHRFILDVASECKVDHKDRDKLHCCRSNLRLCTQAENLRNKGPQCNNTTGFKGVTKRGNRYEAKIRVNKKHIHLGCFGSPQDAARAYDKAALVHHGDFAYLNFPQVEDQ